jgi:hypothetical protein
MCPHLLRPLNQAYAAEEAGGGKLLRLLPRLGRHGGQALHERQQLAVAIRQSVQLGKQRRQDDLRKRRLGKQAGGLLRC